MWRQIASVKFVKEWGVVWSKLQHAGARIDGGFGPRKNPWPGDALHVGCVGDNKAEVIDAIKKQIEAGRLESLRVVGAMSDDETAVDDGAANDD